MKKIAALIASIASLAGLTAYAQQSTSSYSVTADFTYTSNYVFRGLEVADDAFTPSVEISMDDFYLGLWTAQPVTKHQNNEIDIYAGYNGKITDTLSFEVLATYYWYPEAGTYETSKTYEAGVGLTYKYRGITASAYYYYDFRLEASTLVGTVGYSFPIEKLGTSIDVDFYVGTVGTRDLYPDALRTGIKESYNYYGADINVPYHLSEKATLTGGLHYATNDNMPPGTPDDRIWFTIGLSVGF